MTGPAAGGPMRFVLASASPARLATLRAAGIDPEVVVSDVDERGVSAGTPAGTAQLLAEAKAAAVAVRLAAGPHAPAPPGGPGTLVLGCDSLLELDGEALGKPHTPEEAVRRWRRMRGRAGVLHTGHCLIRLGAGQLDPTGTGSARRGATASTTVQFAEVSDAEIDAYVATGEPLAVAGAFTLDGLGGAFVTGISGDPHNVVGVSLPLVRTLLIDMGIAWPDLWTIRAGVGTTT